MVEKIKQQLRSKLGQETIILALEEKGYCVSLLKDGRTVKKESRDVADFQEMINTSVVSWVDFVIDDAKKDAPKVAKELGFSENLINTLLKSARSGYEDLDTELGLVVPAIIVKGFDVKVNPVFVLLGKNVVATLHTTEAIRFFRLRRYAETFMRKIKMGIPQNDKTTIVLLRVMDENNSRNFDYLREIETSADRISAKLADVETPRQAIASELQRMKHALIVYISTLWGVVDVLNGLRYGDAELLTDDKKLLDRFNALIGETHTHINLAEHLSTVLASGLEVMQAIYNNQLQILNNKLALLVGYLTIIGTAVLVPNTLATALSNPAFAMGPQDAGWYTVLLVASTIVSTALAYWWVKKKGFLPEKF